MLARSDPFPRAALGLSANGDGAAARLDRSIRMHDRQDTEGHALVAAVRAAAERHRTSWEALVPDQFTVNFTAEPAEEAAYAEMAEAKHRLRAHICAAYGLSLRELIGLAG